MAYILLLWLPSSSVLHQQWAGFGAAALGKGNRQRLGLGMHFCILCLHLPALLSHTICSSYTFSVSAQIKTRDDHLLNDSGA